MKFLKISIISIFILSLFSCSSRDIPSPRATLPQPLTETEIQKLIDLEQRARDLEQRFIQLENEVSQ